MTLAPIGSAPQACLSVPAEIEPVERQHHVGFAQQFLAVFARETVAGGAACSGWSVGKAAPTLMSVQHRACSFSASATRASSRSSLREHAAGEDHRILRAGEQLRRLLDQVLRRPHRRRRPEARDVRQRAAAGRSSASCSAASRLT